MPWARLRVVLTLGALKCMEVSGVFTMTKGTMAGRSLAK